MSLRWRLALFGTGVVAVVLGFFGVLVFELASHSQASAQDRALATRAAAVLRQIQSGAFEIPTSSGPAARTSTVGTVDLRASPDIFVEIFEAPGMVVFSTASINSEVPAIPTSVLAKAGKGGGTLTTVMAQGGISLRVAIVPWALPGGAPGGLIAVGQPTSVQQANVKGLVGFLVVAAIPMLLAGFGASWMVSRRALQPLEIVAQTTDEIGKARNFGQRLDESTRQDELGRLSRSFNGMLDELQAAYRQVETGLETQRRFVADASHELRTPLTTIRGNAGLLTSGKPISDDDRAAAARDIARESDRMSRLVDALLTLARADTGQEPDLSPTALAPIVHDVCRQAKAIDNDHVLVAFDVADVEIAGDEDLLRQLMWILIDNAFKHTPAGSSIHIALKEIGDSAILAVADDGPGIAGEDPDRVFDRFFQADPSRAMEGSGLGLAIARWIADQHGASIRVRNNEVRGCTFTVTLPILKKSAALMEL